MGEVRLSVPYGDYEQRMAAEAVRSAINKVGNVMFDPPASADSVNATLYVYGPDPDGLFEDIQRALEGVQIPPGTSAIIFGEGEPREVELA